jgi:hypothetical protein
LGIVAAFLALARKPRPWGKLVCAVGVPWIFFTVIGAFILPSMAAGFPHDPLLLFPGIGGATLIAVGLLQLSLDGWRLTDTQKKAGALGPF